MNSFKVTQYSNLIRVYGLRMNRLKSRLSKRIAERNNVDRLIGLLHQDMEKVVLQRRDWHHQWQLWLQEGGALNSGRSYSAHHIQLNEIENVLKAHEADLNQQRAHIQQFIADLKKGLLRYQEKIKFIETELEELKKQEEMVIGRQESQQLEETGLMRWFADRPLAQGMEV